MVTPPQLIVGISMGGLILPHVAIQYPKAKLIFIATGVNFNPYYFLTKMGMNLLKMKPPRKILMNIGDKTPITVLESAYRFFDPFTGGRKDRVIYEKDLKRNLKAIKNHPFGEHLALLDLIGNIDNTEILNKIYNISLIFCGENDILMPKDRGNVLHELLINSRLIVNNGEHFNVFTEKDLKVVNDFLKE